MWGLPLLQRKGPQRAAVDQAVMELFHTALNAAQGRSLDDVYASSSCKLFWYAVCRSHVKVMSAGAVIKQHRAEGGSFCLKCDICRVQRKPGVSASGPEVSARRAAQRQVDAAGGNGGIAVEVRLLPESARQRYAAADVVLYYKGAGGKLVYLLVQADGSQHFDTGHAFPGQTVEGQQQRDNAFNAAALASKFSVARLHHADTEEYDAVLQAALQLLLSGAQPFIFFSKSYDKPLTLNQPGTVEFA
jgi:hypothetical protein